MALGVEALAFVLMRAEEVIARAEGAFSRAARRRAARGDGLTAGDGAVFASKICRRVAARGQRRRQEARTVQATAVQRQRRESECDTGYDRVLRPARYVCLTETEE